MLLSQLFTKTSKEAVADASSRNAELLIRAGFISKTMAGVYSYLPLGLKVLNKIETILREEMDAIASEVFLPSLSSTDAWERTGRLDTVGILFQASPANAASKKTNDSRYVLNSTHEEIITPLMQQFCTSYKDLPRAAYQIQTKFRNEARPKSGLLRGREFRMKDLYSFHDSEADMLRYFNTVAIPAYQRFFERIGLGKDTVIALASGGDFSKEYSREFQTICENGEDHIFRAPGSDIYYNREICPCTAPAWDNSKEKELPREDIVGEGKIGVDELAAFLKIEVERTTKTLLFQADDQVIAVAVRGEYEVNEEKVRKVLGCKSLALASVDTVREVTGAEVGYAGPLNLPESVRVLWDDSTRGRKNFECGANKTNEHSVNVNFGRDIPEPEAFYDLKIAREGDLDPQTGEPYEVSRACEVGNVFTLYTKFSAAFDFTVNGKDGKAQPVYMGCYGIGTSRVMGVVAEMFNDDRGLLWPEAITPADVHIVPVARSTEDESFITAIELMRACEKAGKSVILDDRLDASVGFKLADSDLIGCPVRIVVSPKTLEQKSVEVTLRDTGDTTMALIEDVLQSL